MSGYVMQQKVAKTMELGGSGAMVSSGIGGWVTQNHDLIYFFFGLTGALTAILGLLISIYYKQKADARAAELHKAKMREFTRHKT